MPVFLPLPTSATASRVAGSGTASLKNHVFPSYAAKRVVDMASFEENAHAAIPGTVRMLSGCKDTQTSADVFDVATFELPEDCGPGGAGGACTSSMMKVLTGDDDGLSWVGLLEQMHGILKEGGYTQVPQLSSSRQLSLDAPFALTDSAPGGKRRALLIGINYVGFT